MRSPWTTTLTVVTTLTVAAPMTLAVPATAAPPPASGETLRITGGTTSLALAASAATALADHAIRLEAVAPAAPTMNCPPGVALPVERGELTRSPIRGSLTYGPGGFRFTDGDSRTLEFTAGKADLTTGTTTAVVNGDADHPIPLAEYILPPTAPEARPARTTPTDPAPATELTLDGVTMTLTADATAVFNETFGADVFDVGDALFEHASTLEVAPVLPLPAGPPL